MTLCVSSSHLFVLSPLLSMRHHCWYQPWCQLAAAFSISFRVQLSELASMVTSAEPRPSLRHWASACLLLRLSCSCFMKSIQLSSSTSWLWCTSVTSTDGGWKIMSSSSVLVPFFIFLFVLSARLVVFFFFFVFTLALFLVLSSAVPDHPDHSNCFPVTSVIARWCVKMSTRIWHGAAFRSRFVEVITLSKIHSFAVVREYRARQNDYIINSWMHQR